MNDIFYKVLWVDDDTSIVQSTQVVAEKYNLDLVHFTNWKEAMVELERNFEEYSAIILDAYCKIDDQSLPKESFLIPVLFQMQWLFGKHVESTSKCNVTKNFCKTLLLVLKSLVFPLVLR